MKRDTIEKSRSWGSLSQEGSASTWSNTWHKLIWALKQTNTQIRPKTIYGANQHAQTLYWSHEKPNICANETKYTNGRYAHAYKQYKQKNKSHKLLKVSKCNNIPCYYDAPTKTEHYVTIICNQNTENIVRIIKGTQHTAGTIHSTSLINRVTGPRKVDFCQLWLYF